MVRGTPIAWLARTAPASAPGDVAAGERPSGAARGGSRLRLGAFLAGGVVALAILRRLRSGGTDGSGGSDGPDGSGGPKESDGTPTARRVGWVVAMAVTSIALRELGRRARDG